jgi:hypothetical protein
VSELIREASRDGRRVALLRCFDGEDETLVEVEVTSVRGGATVRRGPYRFQTATDAFRFVQESLLALQYLGCTVE